MGLRKSVFSFFTAFGLLASVAACTGMDSGGLGSFGAGAALDSETTGLGGLHQTQEHIDASEAVPTTQASTSGLGRGCVDDEGNPIPCGQAGQEHFEDIRQDPIRIQAGLIHAGE